MSQPETRYRRVKADVLERDNYRCRMPIMREVPDGYLIETCGNLAAAVTYDPPGGRRLDPAGMVAACTGCMLIVPADESGEYRPQRRQRGEKRPRSRGRRDRKVAA